MKPYFKNTTSQAMYRALYNQLYAPMLLNFFSKL